MEQRLQVRRLPVVVRDNEPVGMLAQAVVARASEEKSVGEVLGGSYVIVDTGPWLFGKKVMLPAGLVREVDRDSGVVRVDRTKSLGGSGNA